MSNQRDETSEDSLSDLPHLEQLDSPAGSPPTASLSTLMELENCFSNLSFAHEIVVNGDFHVKARNTDVNTLEGRVTQIVHQEFWGCLQEQLNETPPNYRQAVLLLSEVKEMLLSVVLPSNVRLRSQIEEVLDMDLIRQEVHHGALDIHRLATFIIDVMASSCAPVRDPEVEALRDLRDLGELLKGIFLILGQMKADLVNFSIKTLRPHLMQQAVHYERAKFQEILDKHPAYLNNTTAWLHAAASEETSTVSDKHLPLSPTAVLNRSYIRLLHWNPEDQKYPETVLMDRTRLDLLSQQLQILILEASVLLLTSAQFRSFNQQGFVGKVKQSVCVLLEGSRSSESDLKKALLAIGEMVLKHMSDAVSTHGGGEGVPQENQDLLRGQISDLWKENNPVRKLIEERVDCFLLATLQAGPAKSSPEFHFPLGLVSAELAELGTSFGRIIHFNRTVFGPFYAPILRKVLLPAREDDSKEGSR